MSSSMWQEVGATLRKRIGESEYQSWIDGLKLQSVEEGNIRIGAPSRFVKDWIDTNLLYEIQQAFHEQFPETRAKRIEITILEQQALNESGVLETNTPVDPRYTFENFVVGKSNELAYNAALRVAESKKILFNPLFLHGGVGLGKTHLMHAIANQIRKTQQDRRVVYVSAEKFMYKFIKALRHKDTVSFKDEFRNIDVLMVDDVQFFSTTNATQEEFFHTFNDLMDNNRQIILSADKSPSQLLQIEERLKSRMGWGLVADIHPTTYELRLGILQSKAEQFNVRIPEKVLEFLACKITSNVRELEGALNRVIAHSQLIGGQIDLDVVNLILRDVLRANDRTLTISDIQNQVAEYYSLKVSDLKSASRRKNISRPRQIAMYFCKELTQNSLPEIGKAFGGKDHTTVIYAIKNVKKDIEEDSTFFDEVDTIKKMLVL